MSKRTLPRWAARGLPATLLGACVALVLGGVACLDPQQDFNDYLARAADAQGPPSGTVIPEAGPPDAALLHAPDAAFTDTKFVMGCLSFLATDPSQIFLFDVTMAYTPKAGGGGSVTWESQSLTIGATSTSSLVGDPLTIGSTPVAKDGTATLVAPNAVVIPKTANPVNKEDVTITPLQVDLHIFADKTACAQLDGKITMPLPATLSPANNPCILKPAPGGNVPAFSAADFHCP